MIHTENPAERLASFFKEGQKLRDGHCRPALEKLLEVKNDNALLLVRLASIVALPMKIKQALDDLDTLDEQHKGFLLKWQGNVEAALGSISFKSPWAKSMNLVKTDDIAVLEACGHTLRGATSVKSVDMEAVDNFIQSLNTLLSEIADSDLLLTTKEYAIERIREIRASFENIKFTGSEAPKKEIEAAIGGLVIHQDIRNELANSKSGNDFFKALEVGSHILSINASVATLAHVFTSIGFAG